MLGWTLFVGGLLGALLTGALHVPPLLPRLPRRARPPRRTHERGARATTARGRARCSSRSACSRCSSVVGGAARDPGRLGPVRGLARRRRRAARRADASRRTTLTSAIAVALGVLGILARAAGVRRPAASSSRTARVRTALEHKLWFDELYDAVFARPGAGARASAPRPRRDARRPGLARRGRATGRRERRRRRRTRPDRAAAHLRARDHRLGRRPRHRLPGGALSRADHAPHRRPARRRARRVDRAALARVDRPGSRSSSRSPRSGSGSAASGASTSTRDAPQYAAERDVVRGARHLLLGRPVRLPVLARRADRRRRRGCDRLRHLGRPRAAARLLRADAVPRSGRSSASSPRRTCSSSTSSSRRC